MAKTGSTKIDKFTPKHQVVFETIKAEILAGKYDGAERLPSEAQLVRRFGISRPTISRALRDLKDAGFVARRAGSGTYLAHGTRIDGGFLGMIIPGYGTTEIFTPICAEIARASQASGYTLLWGDSSATNLENRANQALELCEHYIRQQVVGVFFEPLELIPGREAINHEIIRKLDSHNIPVVLIDRDIVTFPERSSHDLVGIDNFAAGYRVAQHLLERGARRLAFMARPNSAPTVLQRIAGVHNALFNAGLSWSPSELCYGDPEDTTFIRKWLLQPDSGKRNKAGHTPLFDAVICANDVTAARLLATLGELRIKVPQMLRIASFDDVRYASLLTPPLTTIHQPCQQIGSTLVQTLLQRIQDSSLPPREILLDAQLVIRRSSGV